MSIRFVEYTNQQIYLYPFHPWTKSSNHMQRPGEEKQPQYETLRHRKDRNRWMHKVMLTFNTDFYVLISRHFRKMPICNKYWSLIQL